MIFLKKNYKKIPRNKKTRKSSHFFNRFIVHRFKVPTGKLIKLRNPILGKSAGGILLLL